MLARAHYEQKFESLKHDRELISSLKQSMERKQIESAEHENKTTSQLESIQSQLVEIQQKQNENESVKELAEKVTQLSDLLEQTIKETATSQQQETKPKKKKGLWAWLSGE